MTPELEKYYENYFDLFLTDGWKQFIQDIQDASSDFDIRYVKDEGHLQNLQGQLKVLDILVNWEVNIRNAYDSITEEETEE